MPRKIPHVPPGRLPRRGDYNALVDTANAGGLNVGGPLMMQSGAGGRTLALRDLPRIELVRLTGPWQRQLTQGVKDDVISCPAVRLWYRAYDQSPANAYGTVSDEAEIRVYHAGSFPGDLRSSLVNTAASQDTGQPLYGEGDDVYATYNHQSGRWELLAGLETIVRFQLTTPLYPSTDPDTPSTATAKLLLFDPGTGEYVDIPDATFTVTAFMASFHGISGTRGYAKRLADSVNDQGWEVIALDNMPIRKAEVYGGDLVQGDTSPVLARLMEFTSSDIWWATNDIIDLYAGPSFRGVAFGRNASDPNDPDVGDRVDVYYDPESQRWYAIDGGHWMLHGTTAEEMTSAGTTVDVDIELPPPVGAQGPDAIPRSFTISVYSRRRLDDNRDVVIAWNTVLNRWEVLQSQWWALGCGLKMEYKEIAPESPGGPKAEVLDLNLNQVAGPGLSVEKGENPGDCDLLTLNLEDSCGLGTDDDGKLVIVNEDLAGLGLTASDTDCALDVDVGCGLGFDEQDRLAVDVGELAGTGLDASTCSLNVNAGCGLSFNEAGQLVVEPSDLAGTALGVDGGEGECKLGVLHGCGLEIGEFDELRIKTNDLVGRGLEWEGEELGLCKLAVKPGCGIKLNAEDDAVEVDAEAIAGSGLVQEEDCKIGVDGEADDELDQQLYVLTSVALRLENCQLSLERKARPLTFKHNADGFIIGVEIGAEEALADSTVNVANCCCGHSSSSSEVSSSSSSGTGPKLWHLRRCDDSMTQRVVAEADLIDVMLGAEPTIGAVYRDDANHCWIVFDEDPAGPPEPFTLTDFYPDEGNPCSDCLGDLPSSSSSSSGTGPTYYELTRCDDPESVILVDATDLTNPEMGSVHKDDNGDCWEVIAVDAEGEPTAFVEVDNYPPGDDPCHDCLGGDPNCDYCAGCPTTKTGHGFTFGLSDACGADESPVDDATRLGPCHWHVTGILGHLGGISYAVELFKQGGGWKFKITIGSDTVTFDADSTGCRFGLFEADLSRSWSGDAPFSDWDCEGSQFLNVYFAVPICSPE